MQGSSADDLMLSDPGALYAPEDDQFISVSSAGGRIGRFHWFNQNYCFEIQLFNADGTLHQHDIWEVPGSFAFVWTVGDYLAFLLK